MRVNCLPGRKVRRDGDVTFGPRNRRSRQRFRSLPKTELACNVAIWSEQGWVQVGRRFLRSRTSLTTYRKVSWKACMQCSRPEESACSRVRQVALWGGSAEHFSMPASSATTLYAGTGKTLSLICSVLQWLENTQSQENQVSDADSDGDQNFC